MAQYFQVHPTHPQLRLLRQAAEILRRGGVIAYPTDSCYALGCQLGDVEAMRRLRAIRKVDEHHHLTLVCRDLSEIAKYARVDDWKFRLLKRATPGSYTFLLEATREVPRRLQHPKRSTIGLRVPDHPVVQALLEELQEPILSTTLILPDREEPLNEGWEIREELEHSLDAVIDAGSCGLEPTTVIDLSGDEMVVLRRGLGPLALLGIEGE